REANAALEAVCLRNQGLNIAECLARLRRDVSGMQGTVSYDARRSGDEESQALRLAKQGSTRKGRAVRAVLGRLVICTDLARVLAEDRCCAPSQEIHHDRALTDRAQRGGGRDAPDHRTPEYLKRLLSCGIELLVAFDSISEVIDVR